VAISKERTKEHPPLLNTTSSAMGSLDHQFTKIQLQYIREEREVQRQSWSQVTKLFNERFRTDITIDEIRWAYSNLC
jgi:hypothetical protein